MENQPISQETFRARLPRKGEILGVVTEMHGGARMMVDCTDGKKRLCRVPGKIKRQIWVKIGDYVIVEPLSVEGDEKADIAYCYTRVQAEQLRRQGLLKI